jgi:hypothetical protein
MIFGCLQQVAMDEKQDLQAVTGNDKMNISEDTGRSVCGEYQINSTGTEDVKSIKGLQNQESLDQKEVSVPAKLFFRLVTLSDS